MISTKFNEEVINLQILKTGYGHYKFTIDTFKGTFYTISTLSLLVDAIKSNEGEQTRYGTRQDAIDKAVRIVLDDNDIDYYFI